MAIPEGWYADPGLPEETAFLYPAWWDDILNAWPSIVGLQAETWDQYYNFFKVFEEKGLIPYEDLGNMPGRKRVAHKNCPRTYPYGAYGNEIIDEGLWGAFCWECVCQVDPEAMKKIRSLGESVETPGPSCWWILDLEEENDG